MKKLRLAVIGTSGYSYAILNQAWALPNAFEVTVVSAMDPGDPRAAECARRGVRVVPDVPALLAEAATRGCDLVYNPTPIHLHRPIAEAVLEAGFDLVIEKPPVATVQDHLALIALARQKGRRVGIGFNHLYASRLRELKTELLAERYGVLERIDGLGAWVREDSYYARSEWAGQVRINGVWVLDGSLSNPLAHLLSNHLFLAAADPQGLAEVDWVEGELYRAHRIESEDIASVRVRTRDGRLCHTYTTLCAETSSPPLTVVRCERADIEVQAFTTVVIRHRDGRVETRSPIAESRRQMFEALHQAWLEDRPFAVNLDNTLPFTRAVNLAWESSDGPRGVPAAEIVELPSESSRRIMVRQLDAALQEAFESGRLLHETGLAWARAPQRCLAEDYVHFPSRATTLRAWSQRSGARADQAVR